jgi:hypothetical protein
MVSKVVRDMTVAESAARRETVCSGDAHRVAAEMTTAEAAAEMTTAEAANMSAAEAAANMSAAEAAAMTAATTAARHAQGRRRHWSLFRASGLWQLQEFYCASEFLLGFPGSPIDGRSPSQP